MAHDGALPWRTGDSVGRMRRVGLRDRAASRAGAGACVLAATLLSCGGAAGKSDASFGFGDGSVSPGDTGATVVRDATKPPPHDAGHDGFAADSGAGDASDAEACPDASVGDAGLSASAYAVLCFHRCGIVTDRCSGEAAQCGGCNPGPVVDGGVPVPRVCDVATNTCGPILATCADLGATCGTIVNSCGMFLDCAGCPVGQECNPETNQCQTCQPVTCADLGYQCGLAWLGCGPDTVANSTDCGACASGQVCNSVFNLCEPDCMPATGASLCAAAGAQCGVITDGCGGTVDCDTVTGLGCPEGQGCGIVGAANQCDPAIVPDECIAAGATCGTITSACTRMPLSCGTCPADSTCLNGNVCCVPTETLAAYVAKNECGTELTDGCNAGVDVVCAPPAECVDNLTGAPGKTPARGVVGSCCTPADACGGVGVDECAQVPDSCIPAASVMCDKCTPGKTCDGAQCCTPPAACAHSCNVTNVSPDCGGSTPCSCVPGTTCLCNGQPCGAEDGVGTCTCDSGLPEPYACEDVPGGPGQPGGIGCGSFSDGCGGTLLCTCSTAGGQTNNMCVAGQCVCTPSTCGSQVGNGIPDGCGGILNCAG